MYTACTDLDDASHSRAIHAGHFTRRQAIGGPSLVRVGAVRVSVMLKSLSWAAMQL